MAKHPEKHQGSRPNDQCPCHLIQRCGGGLPKLPGRGHHKFRILNSSTCSSALLSFPPSVHRFLRTLNFAPAFLCVFCFRVSFCETSKRTTKGGIVGLHKTINSFLLGDAIPSKTFFQSCTFSKSEKGCRGVRFRPEAELFLRQTPRLVPLGVAFEIFFSLCSQVIPLRLLPNKLRKRFLPGGCFSSCF